MTESVPLQRARLLLSQHRVDQAIEQLQQALQLDPNDGFAHALLALCWLQNKDRIADATRESEIAVHLAPDEPFAYYVMATVRMQRKLLPEAHAAIATAISLDPTGTQYHATQASLFIQQNKWQPALESATKGLEFDPEDESCLTTQSLALERLGRTTDALTQARQAVTNDPNSGYAHAMVGWALLHKHQHKEAQESFREALRLEPTNDFARSGMMEALKSNYLMFRLVFSFYSWLSRLARGAQWAIILGLFFGVRMLRSLARTYPWLEPWITPIFILYLSFALMSWILDPLFNTFLRFNKFGKYLLSDKERTASNLVAGVIVLAGLIALGCVLKQDYQSALILPLFIILLTMPISLMFRVDRGWPTVVAVIATIYMTLLCAAVVMLAVLDSTFVILPMIAYGISLLVFSFGGNWLGTVVVRR